MLRDFFASRNFLALLRFWDRARGRDSARPGAVPDWRDDLMIIPAELRQRVILVEARGADLVYRHLGSYNRKQFGHDPTGTTIAATLNADYVAYLTDVTASALTGGAPIFSCSILRRDNLIKRTARLVAPFRLMGSSEPRLIMSVHFEAGDEFKVTEVAEPAGILETERVRILGLPDICARLEEAGRYHRLSRGMPDRSIAVEWDSLAAGLGAGVIVALPRFGEGRGDAAGR